MNHLLNGLTDPQREAVMHVEGPLLILAGPGSGKTRVVTHRIARLLHEGIPGHQILALTFTNKAADEMKARVERLAPEGGVWLGTFHRFCARLLRKYATFVGLEANYTIYDTGDSTRALRRAIAKKKVDTTHFTPEAFAKAISWAKNNLILPSQYTPRPDHLMGEAVKKVYPAYQAQLAESNAVDFDDLLLHVATLLRENEEIRRSLDERYRFILLDEYQDTNLAQYAIARALSIDHPNLAVTGDPDQSIYGWRGANLNNILEFEKDFPEVRVVRLEQNYRSTKRILRVAEELIRHNVRRKQKSLFTDNDEGPPVRLTTYATHRDEADQIAARISADIHSGRRRARDFAIFYRVNALSRSFEFALRDMGVPYQMVNGLEFFQRKEIKDVLAYLQLLNNPNDEVALLRVINTPTRGIGATTIQRLTDFATTHGLTLLEAARHCRNIESLGKRPTTMVEKFVALFDRLVAVAGGPVEEILGFVLSETGYQKQWSESESEEDLQRLANIEELLTVAREFDERHLDVGHLEDFLEESSLTNDTDAFEEEVDRVTLMTLHASKGLEFPVVYLVAVEEGLLPHERSRREERQLEEERRLMFVAVTRAQQELQISLAQYRDFRGQRKMTVPSHFLMELPRDEMDLEAGDVGPSFATESFSTESFDAESTYVEPTYMEPVFSNSAPSSASPSARPAIPQLTTAAELANGGAPSPTISPDAFHQDMLVRHPEHGLGRIIAISGSGAARKATIDFASPAGRKRFILSSSPIRPVKK
ncbi:MAG TPA: UvrD-helicase domain-containing protein [Thermoguttaceae bacterium]|nr:UvrD-helicase domain-containing protein [Thermoguttaceae bacterium]